MIDLYYCGTPNGHKMTLFLEEAGLPYRVIPVDIGKGEQFKPEFLAISPNNKIPAMVDHAPKGGGKPVSLFESGAMLLYLAEKTAASSRPTSMAAPKSCNGCSGKWAAWVPWRDRTGISMSTRRRRCLTPSSATPRKPTASMAS